MSHHRRLQRERQRRFRERRRREHAERLAIQQEKRALELKSTRPDLWRVLKSDWLADSYRKVYGEDFPDWSHDEPDVIEYRIEMLVDDLHQIS